MIITWGFPFFPRKSYMAHSGNHTLLKGTFMFNRKSKQPLDGIISKARLHVREEKEIFWEKFNELDTKDPYFLDNVKQLAEDTSKAINDYETMITLAKELNS